MMKAAVTTKAGGPSVIKVREVPQPQVKTGWVNPLVLEIIKHI